MKSIRSLFILSLFIFLTCSSKEKPTICLNMIVKNESHVIKNCLDSVRNLIDYWVIVDTGSTDGTQNTIKEFYKDIPGELHERPWVSFGHNRNEALNLARGKSEYILFIDADEFLKYDENFNAKTINKDVYGIINAHQGIEFVRVQLVKSKPEIKWVGDLHEYIDVPDAQTYVLSGVTNNTTQNGARSKDPAKLLRDAMVLENSLQKDPTDLRAMYFLAQSYRILGDFETAHKWYNKRLQQGGNLLTLYECLYFMGLIEFQLNKPESIDTFFKAFRFLPTHAEPLYFLAGLYRNKGDYNLSHFFSALGMSIPMPQDGTQVQQWIYDYGLLFEYSIATLWIGDLEKALQATNILLEKKNIPASITEQALKNKEYIQEKMTAPKKGTL